MSNLLVTDEWAEDGENYIRRVEMLNIPVTQQFLDTVQNAELAHDQLIQFILSSVIVTQGQHLTTADAQVNLGDQEATDAHTDNIWTSLLQRIGLEYVAHLQQGHANETA